MSTGPTLYCYDGSQESERALATVPPLVVDNDVVILTVWQPLMTRVEESGGFTAFVPMAEDDVDEKERDAAGEILEAATARARAAGLSATSRLVEAAGPVGQAIVKGADELDAALIVCATRGRGVVRTALLGSTSHSVLQHAGRPVLILPEPRSA